jgi:hypothetical protein
MVQPIWTYNSTTRKWKNTIVRVFNNNSGADITVREVGLMYRSPLFGSDTYYLFAHDVLASGVVVPNGAQLTVTYEIESQEFTIDSITPAIGTAGSGGYICGYKMTDDKVNYCDQRFLYIISPKSGGESGALKYQTASVKIDANSLTDGVFNTDKMIALGADSPAGQFCSNARTSLLGGYDDWYIPARDEYVMLGHNNSLLPSTEQVSNVNYLSSSEYDYYSYHYRNPVSLYKSTASKTSTPNILRLIRMIHASEFVAA